MNSNANIPLPRLGLGTVAFGRDWGLKYARRARLPSDAELDQLLGTALDLGVTLLDTAPAYGTSEERLGQLLRQWPGRFLLSTKVGETSTSRPQPFAPASSAASGDCKSKDSISSSSIQAVMTRRPSPASKRSASYEMRASSVSQASRAKPSPAASPRSTTTRP